MRQLRKLEPAIVAEVQATASHGDVVFHCSVLHLLKAWDAFNAKPGHITARAVKDVANRLRALGKLTMNECAAIEMKIAHQIPV
jgi:hypothetical protein